MRIHLRIGKKLIACVDSGSDVICIRELAKLNENLLQFKGLYTIFLEHQSQPQRYVIYDKNFLLLRESNFLEDLRFAIFPIYCPYLVLK